MPSEHVVHFFGGFRATNADVSHWASSAREQWPGARIGGWAYPGDATAGDPINHFNHYDMVVSQLRNQDELHWFVGHSSGAAISNHCATLALERAFKNFVLVSLDGFRPANFLLARPSTQVWSAKCGATKSLNYNSLAETSGKSFSVFTATNCHNRWALHFSLVNLSASDETVETITQGYRDCRANLCWREKWLTEQATL
jgi:pimeloyl-ACP methyl ester carboxylesterase